MDGSLIISGKTIATIIRNATDLSPCQIKELIAAAWRECPSCKYHIDNRDVSPQWLGFPAGVKFAPTDLELLSHLEGKVSRAVPHVHIDDYIPTIEEAEGICYTYPQNLPGIKMDGSSGHFFHRVSNAYVIGGRKRRKISNQNHPDSDEHMSWRKTGISSRICENDGVRWKKILVLYKSDKGNRLRTNWTMHQYHLGVDKDEKHGEYVVSRVFYQVESNKPGKSPMYAVEIDPTTPSQPRRLSGSPLETEQNQDEEQPGSSGVQLEDRLAWVAGTSQQAEVNYAGPALPSLSNDDIHETPAPLDYTGMDALHTFLGTPPDLFTLTDSLDNWLDRNSA